MKPLHTNNFLPILDTWPEYFENPYEGLGTTYERFILHKLFEEINNRYDILSVLEVPSFGMTGVSGINSIWWAKNGKQVLVLDDNFRRLAAVKKVWSQISGNFYPVACQNHDLAVKTGSVDLVWNFAALWFIQDLERFSDQIRKIARRVVFICIPNHKGIGYLLRKYFTDINPDLRLENLDPGIIRQTFGRSGWKLWKEGIFDVPPWPDIPMKKEDLLRKLNLGFLVPKHANSPSVNLYDRPTILDYFKGRHPQLEQEVLRYGFLEHAPYPVKLLWGHHRYFIFEKKE